MKVYLQSIFFFFFLITVVHAEDAKVDILLEKVQQSNIEDTLGATLWRMRIELAKINKKARDESNAIIDAKKKLPLKLFNGESVNK